MPEPTILLIEDNPADASLVRDAVRLQKVPARLVVIADGESAIQYIQRETDPPAVIVLDLNLPKKTGIQVLERIRATPAFRDTPVIIFTSSQSEHDCSRTSALGISAYLFKSFDLDEFNRIGFAIKQALNDQGSGGGPRALH